MHHTTVLVACPDNTVCEKQVDKFLNAYCASATFTNTTERVINRTVTNEQTLYTTVYVSSTFTRTVSPTCTFSPGPAYITSTFTRTVSPTCTFTPGQATSAIQYAQWSSPSVGNPILGVLFGPSLVVVITGWICTCTGWICTCWILKNKRETLKSTPRNRYLIICTTKHQLISVYSLLPAALCNYR